MPDDAKLEAFVDRRGPDRYPPCCNTQELRDLYDYVLMAKRAADQVGIEEKVRAEIQAQKDQSAQAKAGRVADWKSILVPLVTTLGGGVSSIAIALLVYYFPDVFGWLKK